MTLCIAFSQKKGTHSQALCEQDRTKQKESQIRNNFFFKVARSSL